MNYNDDKSIISSWLEEAFPELIQEASLAGKQGKSSSETQQKKTVTLQFVERWVPSKSLILSLT